MTTNRPLRTHENVLLTWMDNPGSDDRPYAKDGSIVRRHYSAFMKDRFGSFGHMSMLVHKEPRVAEIEDFEVEEHFRKQGVGKMILRSAIAHLKDQQFTEMYSEEVGPDGLYVRRSVLGEDMQFYEHRDPSRTPIAKTFDEALQHAQQVEHFHEQRERFDPTPATIGAYGISLDLASVDTAGWEQPTPYVYEEYQALIS